MSNVLTDVVPILVAQGLKTLRAAAVMPRLINTDYSNTPANVGDTVNVWIPGAAAVSDVAPSATPWQAPDIQPVKAPIQLNQWRHSGFYLTDKQQEEIVGGVMSKETGEAVKVLAEDLNSYIFSLYKKVYGFVGTPATTPFASDITAATQARAVLNRQRAPLTDRRLVIDVNAEANALSLPNIYSAYVVGNTDAVIQGAIGRRVGMDWSMDQQVPTHTSAALSAGACTVNGVNAVNAGSTDGGRTGTISIAKATNSSPLVAGDIITISGQTQTYTVLSNVTLAVGNTTVNIAPALQVATSGGEAVTLKASHVVNLAFQRDAFALVMRPLQATTANTVEMMSVVDEVTGIPIRLEVSRQNKQMLFDFDLLYGAACVRPELACRVAG